MNGGEQMRKNCWVMLAVFLLSVSMAAQAHAEERSDQKNGPVTSLVSGLLKTAESATDAEQGTSPPLQVQVEVKADGPMGELLEPVTRMVNETVRTVDRGIGQLTDGLVNDTLKPMLEETEKGVKPVTETVDQILPEPVKQTVAPVTDLTEQTVKGTSDTLNKTIQGTVKATQQTVESVQEVTRQLPIVSDIEVDAAVSVDIGKKLLEPVEIVIQKPIQPQEPSTESPVVTPAPPVTPEHPLSQSKDVRGNEPSLSIKPQDFEEALTGIATYSNEEPVIPVREATEHFEYTHESFSVMPQEVGDLDGQAAPEKLKADALGNSQADLTAAKADEDARMEHTSGISMRSVDPTALKSDRAWPERAASEHGLIEQPILPAASTSGSPGSGIGTGGQAAPAAVLNEDAEEGATSYSRISAMSYLLEDQNSNGPPFVPPQASFSLKSHNED